MNHQHKVFIIGICLLTAVIIPYLLFFQAGITTTESDSNGDNSEKETKDIIIPPISFYQNLSKITYIMGANSSGTLDSLQKNDNNMFDIYPSWNISSGAFEYEIIFTFGWEINQSIEKYDIFLYLDIDSPNFPAQLVYFQAYQTEKYELEWKTLYTISNNKTSVNRSYLENVIKFRIYGKGLASNKSISIDQINMILCHKKDLAVPLEIISAENKGHNEEGSDSTSFSRDDNWYEDYPDSYMIYQYADQSTGYATVEVFEEFNLTRGHISWITADSLTLHYNYWLYKGNPTGGYSYSYLYNYGAIDWGWYLISYSIPKGWTYYTHSFANHVNLYTQEFIQNYINRTEEGYNYIRTKSWLRNVDAMNVDPRCIMQTEMLEMNMDAYGWGFDDNYPSVKVSTTPKSPISVYQDFRINAEITSNNDNAITGAKCYIQNETWNSGWLDMSFDSGNTWYVNQYIDDYDFGDYTIWVNATDSMGYNTLNVTDFRIFNARPQITIHTPNPEIIEKIINLYNYEIRIEINDPEDDPYFNYNVDLKIYSDNESDPELNWTNMVREGTTNNFTYTIDPINFTNGIYTLEFRARDDFGYGYNSTLALIQNNPPNITIISPIEIELITPIIQLLQVNITNEEPINTARWTITPSLGSYIWEDLVFNGANDLYEAQINLTSYEYGDYFLVINATDDKYNSSLEVKAIQIHPLLTYYIPAESITYVDSGIIVSSGGTDDIEASFILKHHSIVKERDFEIYIPEMFNDAHGYYLKRGYNTYEPSGYFVEGIYTLWNLPTSQATDIIHFKIDPPQMINQPFDEKDGDYELIFTLSARHSFTDLTIKNTLAEYIPKPENYEYAVFYNYGGEWVEIEDIEIETSGGEIDFSFSWSSIDTNSTIEFKFTATQLDIKETDWTPIIVGATLGAFGIGISVFIIFGFKKHEDWGKAKSILLSIGIGAAAGIIGYIVVLMI
ncbi:MAG: hypothetical protein ACFFDB_00580 [Promethearchaeota archaeon]